MKSKLFLQAIGKFLLGFVLVAALIFLPAGTLRFAQGWLLMGILFIPMLCAGLVMLKKSPKLLRSRLNAKEKQEEQDFVVKLSGLMFIAAFVLAGLNFRFGWAVLPRCVSAAAAVLFLCAYLLYAEVLRENAYLSRTIEIQQGQRVVDSGLYGIVRHPMYAVTVLLFLCMPLVLGSPASLAVMLGYPFIIGRRIRYEERFLEAELPGYAEYKSRVKYRMIPFVW